MGLKMSLGFEFFQNVAALGIPAAGDRRPKLTIRTSETSAATLKISTLGGIESNMPALILSTVPVMALEAPERIRHFHRG